MAKKDTKIAYERHLNDAPPPQGDISWIIGGTIRMYHMWKKQYGSALRKYDPIAFMVGYNEWKLSL